MTFATLTQTMHKTHPWLLNWTVDGSGYHQMSERKKDAVDYANSIGLTLIDLTNDYIENLTHVGYDRLVGMGIEPERADRLTDMGEWEIETDGTVIYYAGDYSRPVPVAQFVAETNKAPFDYQEGDWM